MAVASAEVKKTLNASMKKIIWEIVAIVLGLAVAMINPPEGLTVQAMWTIGILVWAIINWIAQPIPDFVAALFMLGLFVVLKIIPFTAAFGSFASSTWWLLVGALGIGVGVSKSGLLGRVSLMAMKLFPPTYKGQVMALLGAGTIVSPMIPSTTAKMSIAAPVAMGIGDALGLQKKSPGLTGLFCATYVGFNLISPLFLSASFLTYIVVGLLPTETQAQFTWTYWFLCMIPWGVVLLVGSYFAITKILYKVDNQSSIPKDYIQNQLQALGPMKKQEKITAIILVIAIAFWITERMHGIPAVIPALVGMGLLLSFNILSRPDIHTQIPWSLLIFIGSVMSLGSILNTMEISTWLGTTIGPHMSQFLANPYLFITLLTVVMLVARFVLVDLISAFTIFIVVLAPLAIAAGISPFVVAITSYVNVFTWYVTYNNATFLTLYAASGGDQNIEFKKTIKMSFAYSALCLIGLLVSVPLWQFMGLIQ